MSVAGLVSGLAGVGGGFIKTPAMSEIMHVPIKVAAATTTFTVGITAATSLAGLHQPGPHRLPGRRGGRRGRARRRRRRLADPVATCGPPVVRLVLSAALVVIGVVLVVTA